MSDTSSIDTDDDSYLSESELKSLNVQVDPAAIYIEECRGKKCLPISCVVSDIIERQWLDINNRGLKDNDAYCIQKIIDIADEIKGINVAGNYICTNGIHSLLKSLEIHKIVHLNISNTGFVIDQGDEDENDKQDQGEEDDNDKKDQGEEDINNQKKEKEKIITKEILISIMKMPALIDLDISHNYIGDEGMAVFHMDDWRNDIYKINLCDVGFTSKSAKFAALLVNEHPLQEYNISWNCLDTKAVHEFFETLKSIKRSQEEMQLLNISNVNATDANANDFNEFFHNKKFPNVSKNYNYIPFIYNQLIKKYRADILLHFV